MKLGLGTAQFGLDYGITNRGGKVAFGEAEAIIERAREVGVRLVDTAILYGDSELVLGQIGVEDFDVTTKLPPRPRGVGDVTGWLVETIESSLRRLKLNRLSGLLLHRVQDAVGGKSASFIEALLDLQSQGYFGRLGVSVYDPSDLVGLPQELTRIVQAPVNVLDARFEDSALVQALIAGGTEFHARSVLLQGLLTFAPDHVPSHLGRLSSPIEDFRRWASSHAVSPACAAVGHVLASEMVARVIVGVTSLSEFDELCSHTSSRLGRAPARLKVSDHSLIDPSRWPEC